MDDRAIETRLAAIEAKQVETDARLEELAESIDSIKDTVNATQTLAINTLQLLKEHLRHDERLDLN
jgi:hypothetical protein